MIRLTFIAAMLATQAGAATVMAPDAPRIAEGLRVLGMRGEVEVIRLVEYAALDAEPLYLARTQRREAVFREGEDACMSKIAVGVFVACADEVAREVARAEAVAEPLRGHGVTVWPTQAAPPRAIGGGWIPSLPVLPAVPVEPDRPLPPVPPPSPIPLPSTGWLLLAALLTALMWRAAGKFGAWFSAERGAGPSKNGWV